MIFNTSGHLFVVWEHNSQLQQQAMRNSSSVYKLSPQMCHS